MRVVLDTNVLVAAFVAHGACSAFFERVIAEHELVLSPFILEELNQVMCDKLGFSEDRVKRVLRLLEKSALLIAPDPLAKPVCRDADDDSVLALAKASRASYLVTGDDDLLVLEVYEGVPIVTPRTFMTLAIPSA